MSRKHTDKERLDFFEKKLIGTIVRYDLRKGAICLFYDDFHTEPFTQGRTLREALDNLLDVREKMGIND